MDKPVCDLRRTLYGFEGTVYSRLFDAFVPIVARCETEDYVQLCASHFQNIDGEMKDKLLRATAVFALEFVEENGLSDEEAEWDFSEDSPVEDIIKYVFPLQVTMRPSRDLCEEDCPPVFDLEFNCVWEPEHGLEWTVRGDEPVYVGAFDGVSPWDDREDDEYNYLTKL